MARPIYELMYETRRVLGLSQTGLAEQLGVSRRTGQRWNARGGPIGGDREKMARLVFPVDPALAAEIATASGTTLEALGLVVPAPPVPEPSPPVVPVRAPPPDRVVDAVVCAAAEAMQSTPQSVRPAVLAAFGCARELGLTVEDVERALRARLPAP